VKLPSRFARKRFLKKKLDTSINDYRFTFASPQKIQSMEGGILEPNIDFSRRLAT